jgi:hypothetical protein
VLRRQDLRIGARIGAHFSGALGSNGRSQG